LIEPDCLTSEFSSSDVLSLGRVVADAGGNGHLEFVVPNVGPGVYQIVVFCPKCAVFSAGRKVLPVASFRIVSRSQLPLTGSGTAGAVTLALLMIGLGALTIVFTARERVRPPSNRSRPCGRARHGLDFPDDN
jgi:hypothetical protein